MTAASGGLDEEEQEEKKPRFCFLLKTWTIYYITLTFALLAIFRFKQFALTDSSIFKGDSYIPIDIFNSAWGLKLMI